jgi:hypothetical protein
LRKDSQAGIVQVKKILAEASENEKLARKLARKDSVFINQRSETTDIHKKVTP